MHSKLVIQEQTYPVFKRLYLQNGQIMVLTHLSVNDMVDQSVSLRVA